MTIETLSFDPEQWKVRLNKRKESRMKISFNLTGEQAQAWNNFVSLFKPDELDPESFILAVFFQGIQAIEVQMMERVQEEAKNDPKLAEQLEKAQQDQENAEGNQN